MKNPFFHTERILINCTRDHCVCIIEVGIIKKIEIPIFFSNCKKWNGFVCVEALVSAATQARRTGKNDIAQTQSFIFSRRFRASHRFRPKRSVLVDLRKFVWCCLRNCRHKSFRRPFAFSRVEKVHFDHFWQLTCHFLEEHYFHKFRASAHGQIAMTFQLYMQASE